MPGPKLLAVITALMLMAGTSASRADYNLAQLREIERLVMQKDTSALGRYLAANPQITRGDDPLARELRSFVGCVQSGQLDCFASPKVVAKVIQTADPLAAPAPAPGPAPVSIY